MYLGVIGHRAPTPEPDSITWESKELDRQLQTALSDEVARRRPLLAPGELETLEFRHDGHLVTVIYVRTDWGPYRTRVVVRPI